MTKLKIINPKNIRLFKYQIWSLFKNKLFSWFYVLVTLIPIIVNVIFNVLINNSLHPLVTTNSLSIYFSLSLFVSILTISLACVSLLFVNAKKNGSLLYLYIMDYDRKFLYTSRIFTTTIIAFSALFLSFVSNMVISSVYGNISLLFYFSLYVVMLVVVIFFNLVFSFYSFFLNAMSFIVISLITLISLISLFFVLGIVSNDPNSNKLEYNEKIDQNNFAKLYLYDDNKLSGEYVAVKKEFGNEINKYDNLERSFQNPKHSLLRNFSILNIISQATSSIQDSLGGSYEYTSEDIHNISTKKYSFNSDLFAIKNYKTGDPNLINVDNYKKMFISYQDENPLEIEYETLFKRLLTILDKIDIKNKKIYLKSISSKVSDESIWVDQNVKFTDIERDILNQFSGLENNHWLFYIHYYNLMFKNKLVKLQDDLVAKYDSEIASFVSKIFLNNDYRDNLINYGTIVDIKKLADRFPMIGAIDKNKDANSEDISYFKDVLIHTYKISNKDVFKILTPSGYEEIDLNKIDPTLSNKQAWDEYIDKNKEIINLTNIYNNLFSLNNNIATQYNFSNNINDIYMLNRIMVIERNSWIKNIWIHIMALIFASIALYYISKKIAFKKEGKNVE